MKLKMKNRDIYTIIITIAVVTFGSIVWINEIKKEKVKQVGANECPELSNKITTDEFNDLVELWSKMGTVNLRDVSCFQDYVVKMNDKLENLPDNEIRDKISDVQSRPKKDRVDEVQSRPKKDRVDEVQSRPKKDRVDEVQEFKDKRDDLINKIEK